MDAFNAAHAAARLAAARARCAARMAAYNAAEDACHSGMAVHLPAQLRAEDAFDAARLALAELEDAQSECA